MKATQEIANIHYTIKATMREICSQIISNCVCNLMAVMEDRCYSTDVSKDVCLQSIRTPILA